MPVPVPGYTLPHIPPHILDAANQQRQQPQVKQPVPQPHSASVQDNPAAGINFLQVIDSSSLLCQCRKTRIPKL